jgi:hypothetical protein
MYQKFNHLFSFIFAAIFFSGCASFSSTSKTLQPQPNDFHLKFLDVYTIPHNLKFKETIVGGLSGIDYDKNESLYYIISDERSATSPSRFYTANIHIENNKISDVNFLSVHHLTNSAGNTFPSLKEDPVNAADPESIRYNPAKKNLVWTDEGDKANRNGALVVRNPWVYEMNLNGNYIDSFSLPKNFCMKMGEEGPRTNSVFEGCSFDEDFRNLYVSVEEPLFEDGARADVNESGAPIRIIKFDTKTRKPVAQFVYLLDAVAKPSFPINAYHVNGVSEILWLNKDQLLIMERSFSMGVLGCTIKVYIADLKNATDVSNTASLKENKEFVPASKRLLLNMDSLKIYVDNVEGITFGPKLPNGNQSLIFIVDNNFQAIQQQQVLLFEMETSGKKN